MLANGLIDAPLELWVYVRTFYHNGAFFSKLETPYAPFRAWNGGSLGKLYLSFAEHPSGSERRFSGKVN
jgi:hypothetical protein